MDEEGLQDILCLNDNQYEVISIETTNVGLQISIVTSFTQIEYFVKESRLIKH